MRGKSPFNYIGISQITEQHEAHERLEFSIRDIETGKELAYVITNGNLEGSWRRNTTTGALDQVAGTCQFSLPRSAEGVRKLLRKKALLEVSVLAEAEAEGGVYQRIYDDLIALKR